MDRLVTHEATDGEGQPGAYLIAQRDDKPTPHFTHGMGRGHHRLIIGPNHNQVMMVVGHAARNRSLLQTNTLDEAQTEIAAGTVALNHGYFEQITAGEYKRTLTVFGENTEQGREKLREDLEEIHEHFKEFIATHRPEVEIDRVATGEVWLGGFPP